VRADLDLVRRLGSESAGLVIVATTRPDGSVHASLVNAGVLDDPATGEPVVGLVVRGDARKLTHFRRSGRAAATFHSGWQWVTVEGPVSIIGPDDGDVRELLRTVFRAAGGSHDDWDEYDRVMAAERRVAVLIRPARVVTN
jgi:PPOX class probable F420-dependent enzyme